jgi:hypothetical protein
MTCVIFSSVLAANLPRKYRTENGRQGGIFINNGRLFLFCFPESDKNTP